MNVAALLLLADVVLALHFALASFLALGLAAILVGGPQWRLGLLRFGGWRWVRNRTFRIVHLAGLAVVAAESVLGMTCPLTDVETILRASADFGQPPPSEVSYQGGFIAYWLGRLLYYNFDERVFLALYLLALGLTVWAWKRWPRREPEGGTR